MIFHRENESHEKQNVYLENETLIFERSLNPGRATINETFRCMPVREGHLSCEKKKEGRKDRWTCKKHLKNLCTWRCKRTGSVRLRDLRTWKMDTLTRQGGGGKGRATRVYRESTNHGTRNKSASDIRGIARCVRKVSTTTQDHPVLENSKRVPSFPPGIINNRAVVTPTREDSRPSMSSNLLNVQIPI